MSLINQVLRDLQGRQAAPLRNPLQIQLRAVAAHTGRNLLLLLLLVLIVLSVIAARTWQPGIQNGLSSAQQVSRVAAGAPASEAGDGRADNALKPPENRLAGIHLQETATSARLVLEFSQQTAVPPETYLVGRQLTVLLPQMVPATQLPQIRQSVLLAGMTLEQQDHLWRLNLAFTTDVSVEPLRLSADSLHGERLAIDIYPLAPAQPAVVRVAPKPAAGGEAAAPVLPSATQVVAKKNRVSSPQERVDALYLQGVEEARQQKMAVATDLWRQVLLLSPSHIMARKQLILSQLQVSRKGADQLFNEGLALHEPRALQKWYARALLPTFGAEQAAAVMDLAPVGDEEYRALQAGLWQQAGDYSRSEQGYQELLKLSPEKSLYRFGLAVSLDQQSKSVAALDAYRRALEAGLDGNLSEYARERITSLVSVNGAGS